MHFLHGREALHREMLDDVRRLLRSIARVGRAILGAPPRWRARQWSLFFAFALATWLAYLEKLPVQSYVERSGDGVARRLASFADVCGGGFATTSLALAALCIGRAARKPAVVDAAIAVGAAGVWCWAMTTVGQLVLAERRPSDGGVMRLFALGGHGVSGHASAAALLYWPVRDILARGAAPPVRRAVGLGLAAWAALVGWSRVWLGMHFLWNVMLGLAIGSFTGYVGTRALLRPGDPHVR